MALSASPSPSPNPLHPATLNVGLAIIQLCQADPQKNLSLAHKIAQTFKGYRNAQLRHAEICADIYKKLESTIIKSPQFHYCKIAMIACLLLALSAFILSGWLSFQHRGFATLCTLSLTVAFTIVSYLFFRKDHQAALTRSISCLEALTILEQSQPANGMVAESYLKETPELRAWLLQRQSPSSSQIPPSSLFSEEEEKYMHQELQQLDQQFQASAQASRKIIEWIKQHFDNADGIFHADSDLYRQHKILIPGMKQQHDKAYSTCQYTA